MAYIAFYFEIRNAGDPVTGLTFGGVGSTPGWTAFKTVSINAGTGAVTLANATPPTITEIGEGMYVAVYDPDANGEAMGQIDAGASLASSDRYISIAFPVDSSRIVTDLKTTGTQLDLTQAVPTSNTAQTVGDALNAARAQGFGKWTVVGTTLTLYAANGTTVIKTFTLDDPTNPTRRF